MNFYKIILFLFTISSLSASLIDFTKEEINYLQNNKQTIKMCANPIWAPIGFYNEDTKQPEGISIDTMRLIEKKLGKDVKFKYVYAATWKESQQLLKDGKCDFISLFKKNEKRAKYALFTKPYMNYKFAIITRNDRPFVTKFEDIIDKAIARKKGSGMIYKLKKDYPGIKIIETKDFLDSLQKVSKGEVYAAICTLPVLSYNANRFGIFNVQIAGYTTMNTSLSIGVRKSNPILHSILEKGLAQISEEEHKKIQDKWMSVHIKEIKSYNNVYITLSIILFIIVIYYIYKNYQSKKRLEDLNSTLEENAKELETIVNERTKELEKSRLAAISIMEDANTQRKIANKANVDLQDEIKIREETQAQLEKAKKDAEYANRSKSIFLANMSHELRTPLNAIMGFSELLRKNPNIQSEQKETLEIIHTSGDHLLKLINDVLDLAKIESGKIPIDNEPFDLGNIITESVDLMEQRAEAKGLKLELDQSSSFPRYIISDAGKIRQILLNFLSNAVKNTYEGGIKVKLELEDNFIHMEVSDSGVGIAKENLNKLFEPFVQIGSASTEKGTGLGLTITKQFVELLGGTIGVESELGKGSSFWAKIPFEKSSKDDVVEIVAQEHKEVIGLDPSQKNIKILIVEDQVENRLLLKSLLDLLEIQVKEAVNGEEAIEIYKSWKPDFIWMDRRMPKMNGERATQEIRKLEDGDKVIIVALTASAFHEERERMLAVGMDDFVAKPYRQSEIYEMMQKHLNLNYIYQESKIKGTKEIPKFSEKDLKDMIEKLDKEIVQELETTVILLDSESLKPILDKIENIDKSLADILISLVDNYDFGRIIKVLQSIKEGQDGK